MEYLEAKKAIGLKWSNITFPNIENNYMGKQIPVLSLGDGGQVNTGEVLLSIPYDTIIQDLEEMKRLASEDQDLALTEVLTVCMYLCMYGSIYS